MEPPKEKGLPCPIVRESKEEDKVEKLEGDRWSLEGFSNLFLFKI